MGKLRITQKGRDVRRVAASIAAYLGVAIVTVAGLYVLYVLGVATGSF
jgi:hypothetical protein